MRDSRDDWVEERVKTLDAPISRDERLEQARQIAHACRLRVEQHDPYTKEHSVRVARWARVIAARLPTFDQDRLDRLEITALVHDFGKIDVPAEILNKAGGLTDAEVREVQKHPVRGAIRLETFSEFVVLDGVLFHHLRFEGGGYPDGAHYASFEIPLEARIIAVADTFDALTSNRAYRPGIAPERALSIMRKAAGNQLDPTLVRIFEDYYRGESERKGYSPGTQTMELSATIDEEIRRALSFLQESRGTFDIDRPLQGIADPEGFVRKAVEHLVSLTIDRREAELFVRAAYKLPLPDTFRPEDIVEAIESRRTEPGGVFGHRRVILTMRDFLPEYRSRQIAAFRGRLWKCVGDGRRMVLLR